MNKTIAWCLAILAAVGLYGLVSTSFAALLNNQLLGAVLGGAAAVIGFFAAGTTMGIVRFKGKN